jgi:hypothetical protein
MYSQVRCGEVKFKELFPQVEAFFWLPNISAKLENKSLLSLNSMQLTTKFEAERYS